VSRRAAAGLQADATNANVANVQTLPCISRACNFCTNAAVRNINIVAAQSVLWQQLGDTHTFDEVKQHVRRSVTVWSSHNVLVNSPNALLAGTVFQQH